MKKMFVNVSCMLILTLACLPSMAQNAEFADMKYAEIGKRGLQALSDGNIDKWMSDFADNARYIWNSGDSLVGKAAISKYWKDRRSGALESITFTNQIWLPIIVKSPQATEAPGVWALSWYLVEAKYKTGKTMRQWIHTDLHFDKNDKVDQVIQYLDREPINAAMKK